MAEPITIDDDEVVMVGDLQVLQIKDPVVIDDEDDDKINNDKPVNRQSTSRDDTIVLDDDPPTTTEVEKTTKVTDNKIEKSFVTNLENNRLLDKIVTRVTTMENSTGMHRVVQKTLLPLYRDANNRFKESDEFRTMLKKTYKLLMKDPDHKFLHIKTLCEELKSGGLRRKVPFVTLATNVKKSGFDTDLTSSSKEMDQNTNNNVVIIPIPEINRKNYITQKKRKKGGKGKKRGAKKKKVAPTRAPIETRSCVIVTQTEKTDVIELDDSETESQGEAEDDPKNDVIFIDETDQKNDIPNTLLKEPLEVPQEFDKVLKVRLEDCNKENQAIQKDSRIENEIIKENQETQKASHNENKMVQENQVTQKDSHNENKSVQEIQVIQRDSHSENKLAQENQVTQKDFHNENKVVQDIQVIQRDSHNENRMVQPTLEVNIYKYNIVTKSTLQKDSDKQNLLTNTQTTFPIDLNKRNTLLVPTMGNVYTTVPATAEDVNVPPIVSNIYDRQGKLIGVEIESELGKQYKRTQPIITNYAENGNPVIIDAFSYKENTERQATDTNTQNKMLLESELSKQYNRTQPIIKYYAANGNPVIIEAFSYKENTEPQATDTNTQNKVLLESELSQYKRTQPIITNYADRGNPVIIGAFSYKENTGPQATDSNTQNKVLLESELSQYKRTQPIITNYADRGNPVIIGAFSYKENTGPQATDSNTQNKVLLESELSQYKRTQPIITNYADRGNPVIIGAFSYKENTGPQATDSNTQNKVLLESELSKQYKITQPIITNYADRGNPVIIGAFSYKENTEPQATDTNTQNKVLQDTEDTAKNGRSSNKETDYDLLIPQTCLALVPNKTVEPKMDVVLKPVTVLPGHITVGSGPVLVGPRPVVVGPVPLMEVCKPVKEVEQDNRSQNAIAQLEMRIADLKKCVDILEETEVISESYHGSAYYICSKYKEDIVQSYKKICQLKGDSQALVKKRQIRLQVTEGHPPGPAKRLEDLLNRSINSRGEIPFPSFPDVLKCVVDADLYHDLCWDRHTIMQEAVALFRQCGQALRKRRQQREYKDLLSLIRNDEETDDPAENDPILLAKLEENKRIALKKEEEILDRYVAMEQNPNMYAAEFHSDKNSSDSDEESEQNIPSAGESSRNTIDNVSILPNNPPNSISNHSTEAPSSNTDNILVSNLVVTPTLVTAPDSSNPILMTYLLNAPTPPQKLENYMNENPPSMRDRLIMHDDSNEDSDIESEGTDISDYEEKFNIETELTVTDTTVGFNNETSKKGDLTSGGRMSNIENENLTTNNQPCNINDSADGIKQNCDSSISTEGASVKTEDRVKTEPVDVQNMFDELGDGFVCQVFDIEDPFLVIEISSDESSDDEEL